MAVKGFTAKDYKAMGAPAAVIKLKKRLEAGEVLTPAEHCEVLRWFRDTLEASRSGMYSDKASREWRELPAAWRMSLLLLAGMGGNEAMRLGMQLQPLAARNWREFPPPEQEAVRSVVRLGRPHMAALQALAARV